MAIFDNFPYTNIHDLNTDWLIKTVKQIKDKTDTVDQSVLDAIERANKSELYAEILTNTFLTPEMFGAIGDGLTDDTTAIQTAINNGKAQNKAVYMPNQYLISAPLELYGTNSTYQKHGSVLLGGANTKINTTQNIPCIIKLVPDEENETRAYGIIIKDLILNGHNTINSGIYSDANISECIFENITINFCIHGVYLNANCYLCNFTNVRPFHCVDYGFRFENGTNTSNIFSKCYVDTCANAYKYNGQYSAFICCCADVISNIVFDLTSFRGVLLACGSESKIFTQMFHIGQNTIADVLGGMYFSNPDLSGYYIRVESGSVLRIESATLNYNNNSAGALYSLAANTRLVIRNSDIVGSFATRNYSSSTARYKINTAVETVTLDLTVDSNNEVTVPNMSPNTYTILSAYSTTRTEWIILPYRFNATTWKLKFMTRSDYFPTIANKDFTVLIKYVTDAVL